MFNGDVISVQSASEVVLIPSYKEEDECFGSIATALTQQKSVIMMERSNVATKISLWMKAGAVIHECSLLSAFASVFLWNRYIRVSMGLAMGSLFLTGLHSVIWQGDPCMDYRLLFKPKPIVTPDSTLQTDNWVVMIKHKDVADATLPYALACGSVAFNLVRMIDSPQ